MPLTGAGTGRLTAKMQVDHNMVNRHPASRLASFASL
jgi:hypothetical protein